MKKNKENRFKSYYGLVRLLIHIPWWNINIIKVSPFENKKIKPKDFKEEFGTETGRLLVANHTSMWDIPFAILPYSKNEKKIFTLAKKELFKFKILSNFFTECGAISVDRKIDDHSAAYRSVKTLAHDKTLLIFPEGTRRKDGLITNDCNSVTRLAKVKGRKTKEPVNVEAINIQYKWPSVNVYTRNIEIDEIPNIKDIINDLPNRAKQNKKGRNSNMTDTSYLYDYFKEKSEESTEEIDTSKSKKIKILTEVLKEVKAKKKIEEEFAYEINPNYRTARDGFGDKVFVKVR